MRKLVLILIATVLPLLLSTGNVRADRVVLQNDDTLTGTLVKVQGEADTEDGLCWGCRD